MCCCLFRLWWHWPRASKKQLTMLCQTDEQANNMFTFGAEISTLVVFNPSTSNKVTKLFAYRRV